MSSAGTDDDADDPPWPGWLVPALVALAALAVLSLYLISTLLAILFPPLPPLPAGALEVRYTQRAFGVEEWRHTSSQDACTIVDFYRAQGAVCEQRHPCGAQRLPTASTIARCEGVTPYGGNTMRWRVVIAVDGYNPAASDLWLERELYWTPLPSPTPRTD
jgi:hypothetical protein